MLLHLKKLKLFIFPPTCQINGSFFRIKNDTFSFIHFCFDAKKKVGRKINN